MPYLVDTNVLLRWAYASHPDYPLMRLAIETLQKRAEPVYITPQNIIEFWNVSTRPIARNGFGFQPAAVDQLVSQVRAFFLFAEDTPDIFPEWLNLVAAVGVSGVQVHDARLAAVMKVHGLTHTLTLNPTDFSRYPGITPVHPQNI